MTFYECDSLTTVKDNMESFCKLFHLHTSIRIYYQKISFIYFLLIFASNFKDIFVIDISYASYCFSYTV